jgi:hypothetical protein
MNSSGIVTSTRIIGSSTTGFAFGDRVLDRHRTGDLERHLGRVTLVVGPSISVTLTSTIGTFA